MRPPSPPASKHWPAPGSPTYSYTSTPAPVSAHGLPLPSPPLPVHSLLNKQDLAHSQQAYTDLANSAKTFRQALASLSAASSSFASAIESCARLKESRAEKAGSSNLVSAAGTTANFATCPASGSVTADALLAAAGLHHLLGNHHQILSETVYRSFEVPLLHDLDKWKHATTSENESYVQAAVKAGKEIRKLEQEGVKLQKARQRQVGKFRAHLVELTSRLDGLTQLHATHAMTLLRESQETSVKITEAACSLVRAEVEIFESLARKGWTGGGLEHVLEKGVDLFAAEDVVASSVGVDAVSSSGGDGGLFSILPPKSILADATFSPERNGSMALGGPAGHVSPGSILSVEMAGHPRPQFATADPSAKGEHDSDSIFGETRVESGRRPFSPQPIRRVPIDARHHSLGVSLGEPSGSVPHVSPVDEKEEETSHHNHHHHHHHHHHDDVRDDDKSILFEHEDKSDGDGRADAAVGSELPTTFSLVEEGDEQQWKDEGLTGGGRRSSSPVMDRSISGSEDGKNGIYRWATVSHCQVED